MAPKFNPGGHKGKLHREMGIPEGEKIPAGRLKSAMNSSNREVRNDAIRANTMKHWNHKGRGK
jgi:oligoendopeptidase F